jgi:hypothetical protein
MRSLSSSRYATLERNGSADARHATAAAGKNAHLWSAPKREDPSRRPVSVKS